jgi:phage tail-like protein
MPLDTPLHVFRFYVTFHDDNDDHEIARGAFSEVSGLEATMEPVAISEGGRNWGQRQLAGRTTFSTVILKRGISPTRHLWDWFYHVGGRGSYANRLNVVITLQDAAGTDVLSWTLWRALPVKLKIPDLAAAGQELGIEELHLVFDGLTESAP